MLRVRPIRDLNDFVGAPGDPDDYAESVRSLWESGESRPDWCFVLEEGGDRIGRIGYRVSPTVTDPAWLGSLPSHELFVFGWHLPWDEAPTAAARELLEGSLSEIADELPHVLELRINNSVHDHHEVRVRLARSLGMDLFQEKIGFTWEDDGSPLAIERLSVRTVDEVGANAYAAVMARCGEGTLDRNDVYYWQGCGPENWAAQMTAFLSPEDDPMWLIGYAGDDPVGYVAVSAVEDWGSTITHIGVVPEHRGNGYVRDLLRAGMSATRAQGITTMLSDVDALNHPMRHAMTSVGQTENPDRWHVWAFRTPVDALAAQ